jgi:hypothetical protein
MRKLIICALCLFQAGLLSAQNSSQTEVVPSRTAFYAELGGPGILFSANVDQRFKRSHLGWGWRAGVGFVTSYNETIDPNTGWSDYENVSVITVPAQINYIFGKGVSPHTFEVGAGFTYVGRKVDIMEYYDEKESQLFGTFAFMYRRQPMDGGFMWRIGFSPLVAKGFIQPFAAVAVGYSF